MATLSAADSQLAISVAGLFSSPQPIQGYDVDDAFMAAAVDQAETRMGVDSFFSGGKVFVPYQMTIRLQATSPSIAVFDAWRNQQDAVSDVFIAQGSILLPSIGKSYTLQSGYLTKAVPFPGVKKILAPAEYEITWGKIIAAPTF